MTISKKNMNWKKSIIIGLFLFFGLTLTYSQSDKEQILALREDSNMALKENNLEKVLSFLTEDVLLTSGHGNLKSGKKAIREYTSQGDLDKYYWLRTPIETEVNEKRGIAWETGTWKVYDRNENRQSQIGGKYSAMWTNETGSWLIKSQLFVTLE